MSPTPAPKTVTPTTPVPKISTPPNVMKPTAEHRPIHVKVDVCFYEDYRTISVEGINGPLCVRSEPCGGKNSTYPGV